MLYVHMCLYRSTASVLHAFVTTRIILDARHARASSEQPSTHVYTDVCSTVQHEVQRLCAERAERTAHTHPVHTFHTHPA